MKIQWERITTRGKNFSLLLMGAVACAFKRGVTKKFYGLINPLYYRQFNNSRWFSEDYINKIVERLKNIWQKNPARLLVIAKKYQSSHIITVNWSKKYKNKDFKKYSNQDLTKIWQGFFDKSDRIFGVLYFYIFVNKFLPDELTQIIASCERNFDKQNHYLKILFSLDRASETRKEKESLLKIVKLIKDGKAKLESEKLSSLIISHLKQFDHLGQYYYFQQPYTYRDIISRIKNLLKKDISRELANLAEQKRVPLETKKIVKGLKLDKKTILTIQIIKEWAFAGNSFDEKYTETICNLKNLISETAKRLKITVKEVTELIPDEILDGLKQGGIEDDFKIKLKERLKESAISLEKGKIRIISGNDLKKYYQQELKEEEKIGKTKQISGQPASPGLARGRVHVVWAIEEIATVKKGEILVAPATTPAHVPAMEKAAAIVTDEGGLLSHAAIVSRELGVPCIVGTKIGTKALKDGDLVEVDASKGIVRKI
jgi:phosphoenolpyruvate synthase/pyruvate phosphate dikinase